MYETSTSIFKNYRFRHGYYGRMHSINMENEEVSYSALFRSGELQERIGILEERMRSCDLCPRKCNVDRITGERGFCRTGRRAKVASYGPHFGEERPLVGRSGSGTIFFSGCNLACQYCQNWDISQKDAGNEVDAEELAGIMMKMQGMGCHNINLVSPSHVVFQLLEALEIACMRGLEVPIVYNTGGYDSVDTLRFLDGVIDIYMPDMKYSDPEVGRKLSLVEDYPESNRQAVKEMHRQVGDLEIDDRGVACRGLLVRHLVLPNGLAGTGEISRFLAEEISKDTYINIMAQYRPEYKSCEYFEIDRKPNRDELIRSFQVTKEHGLWRFDRL
jgi:putative pyruvate formate lyase activating enzyme